MRNVCDCKSFLKSTVVIFKTLGSKTIPLRCTHTGDRLYNEVPRAPLPPEKEIPYPCSVTSSKKSRQRVKHFRKMRNAKTKKYSKYENI